MLGEHPDAIPMLAYKDRVAALWLAEAFSFCERTCTMQENALSHGEIETGRGMIMLATPTLE